MRVTIQDEADSTILRINLWGYALLHWASGMYLFGWAEDWLAERKGDLAVVPLIKIFGAVMAVLGCLYVVLAGSGSSRTLRRSLLWSCAGYGLLFGALVSQSSALNIVWPGLSDRALTWVGTLFALAVISWSGTPTDNPKKVIEVANAFRQLPLLRWFGVPRRRGKREAVTQMRIAANFQRNAELISEIQHYCESLARDAGVSINCWIGLLPGDENLLSGAHQAIFRVTQEALDNAVRHAHASSIQLSIEAADGCLRLRVIDNGVGVEGSQAKRGSGVSSMFAMAQEFDATLSFNSSPGHGMAVEFAVPYVTFTRENNVLRVVGVGILTTAVAAYGYRVNRWVLSMAIWLVFVFSVEVSRWWKSRAGHTENEQSA